MKTIRIPALEITQGPRTLYTFAIDGKQIHSFATVSRLKRDASAQLGGYQRPEVLSHIANIRSYIESSSPMIPNAVVLAFDASVTFEPLHGSRLPYSRYGELLIPIDENDPDEKKPGFIVDGQQRLAAVREAEVEAFPMCVTAFIACDVAQQTEQFLLVNSTKPLSRSLIYELLPEASANLPAKLQKKRLPSYLLTRLNHEASSPLYEKIKTTTNPTGHIKDTGLLQSIEASLSDGVLYRFDNSEDMEALLRRYWSAVSHVFQAAWKLPPKKSRLWHGASIVALGLLLDTICAQKWDFTAEELVEELQRIATVCRWTEGRWEFELDSRRWDDIQNTPKDIALLSGYLSRQYKKMMEGR